LPSSFIPGCLVTAPFISHHYWHLPLLRYLILGRNVRKRNMSTREPWVLPGALTPHPTDPSVSAPLTYMTNIGGWGRQWAQITWK
jgi:hypothetical protein